MKSSLREMLRNNALAKSPNYGANSQVGEDKNVSNVRYLGRGGGSGIRTMNLHRRIHLKTVMNSASWVAET
jgi:hypothetical protein